MLMVFVAFTAFATPVSEMQLEPRIAVVSAFGAELETLKGLATIEDEVVINGRSFTLGELEGDSVVMFLSGVSMVNAAMTMQLAIDNFNITHIVFSGIAGGVNPDLNIGDVTIPAQWAHYQEVVYARQTEDGWDAGWHEVIYPNFYMAFPQTTAVTSDRVDVDGSEEMFWFPVDEEMLEAAYAIQDDVEFRTGGLEYPPKLVVGGNGVSGMTFVDNAEYREYAFEVFGADCLDMESSAIAHVAYANEIPFLVFRSLSDLAGGGPGENQIGTFFGVAANNAAEVLVQWLREWE